MFHRRRHQRAAVPCGHCRRDPREGRFAGRDTAAAHCHPKHLNPATATATHFGAPGIDDSALGPRKHPLGDPG
jgi:hypothetical protein